METARDNGMMEDKLLIAIKGRPEAAYRDDGSRKGGNKFFSRRDIRKLYRLWIYGPMTAEEASGLVGSLWAWKSYLILILTPILLSPLPAIVGSSESRCGYVVLIMAVYWVTESLPISVTALIPLVAFPLLEILSSDEVAIKYMNDVNVLFLGGLIVAIAVEHWNLHRRIALRILLFAGVEPRWLMLGMMVNTWFLSMWISNTATTAMMMPIMEAILVQLKHKDNSNDDLKGDGKEEKTPGNGIDSAQKQNDKPTPGSQESATPSDPQDGDLERQGKKNDFAREHRDRQYTRMCKGLSLSICYAANCGGIASLTGTGPNLVLKSNIDNLYEAIGESSPVSFGTWMAFGLPLSLINLAVCWCWLNLTFLRCRGLCNRCTGGTKTDPEQANRVKQVIRDEYNSLGPMVFGQAMVLFLFVCLVALWITRDMGGMAGWGSLFNVRIKDGAPAILIAMLLFVLPSTLPCLKSYKNYAHPEDGVKGREERGFLIRPLLDWKVVHEKFPWRLLFLLGGGFAISAASEKSGLSQWVAHQLEFFSDWNQWAILFIFCYVTAAATEVTSNTAISTILMPIMIQLAVSTEVHPLYYMFPTALACSFAFMLPVATPPNAIVFTYGRVSISDMMRSGIVLNLLTVPILIGMTGTLGDAIFDFQNIPENLSNSSATAMSLTKASAH